MVSSRAAESRARDDALPDIRSPRPTWNFLTNHPVVLVYVVQHPESTVRQIAGGVGLTERATLAILRDLDEEGLVDRHRTGRRNTYIVNYGRLLGLQRGGGPNGLGAFMDQVVHTLQQISPRPKEKSVTVATKGEQAPRVGSWGFFTNHLLVLSAVAAAPDGTVRELSGTVGITERATVAILNQLEAEGIIIRQREGRRNHYTIDLTSFRRFRGWHYEGWSIPSPLIDVATNAVRALMRS